MTQGTAMQADVRWGLPDALLSLVIAMVAGAVGAGLILAIFDYSHSQDAPLGVVALLQIPLWVGLLGVPWWASRRKGSGSLRSDYGLTLHRRDVPVGLGLGIASQLAMGLVAPLYRLFDVDPDGFGENAERLADRADDPLGVAILVLITVVCAPIIEEICWRGLWLRAARSRFGVGVAVVLTGLLFGAAHFSWLDLLPLALFGMLLAAVSIRTGRLGLAIVTHAAFNAVAVVSLVSSS